MTSRRRGDRLLRSVVLVAAVAMSAACGGDDGAQGIASGRDGGQVEATTTSLDPCLAPDPEAGRCGIPFEELRELNLRHADRLEFSGDLEQAHVVAVAVEGRLESLLATVESPSLDDVDRALREVAEYVTVSDEAVRAAGIAFAVEVAGGCVFGDIGTGTPEVEIGGFVRDGGCLAVYGH